jgi:nucleoprotein TPR
LEKNKNEKLESTLNMIYEEFEKKTPKIKEQKEEYERLTNYHIHLTKNYQNLLLEESKDKNIIEVLKKEKYNFQYQNNLYEKQVEDISNQLQNLLKENNLIKKKLNDIFKKYGNNFKKEDFEILDDEEEFEKNEIEISYIHNKLKEKIEGDEMSSRVDILRPDIIKFKDIREIQLNNRELIKVIRKLCFEKEEEREKNKKMLKNEYQNQYKIIKNELESLKSERINFEEKVENIIKQRDMYKKLLEETNKEIDFKNLYGNNSKMNFSNINISTIVHQNNDINISNINENEISLLEQEKIKIYQKKEEIYNDMKKMSEEYEKNRKLLQDEINIQKNQNYEVGIMLSKKEVEIELLTHKLKNLESKFVPLENKLKSTNEKNNEYLKKIFDSQNSYDEIRRKYDEKFKNDILKEEEINNLKGKNKILQEKIERHENDIIEYKNTVKNQENIFKSFKSMQENLENKYGDESKNKNETIFELKEEIKILKNQNTYEKNINNELESKLESIQILYQDNIKRNQEKHDTLFLEFEKNKVMLEKLYNENYSLNEKIKKYETKFIFNENEFENNESENQNNLYNETINKIKDLTNEIKNLNEIIKNKEQNFDNLKILSNQLENEKMENEENYTNIINNLNNLMEEKDKNISQRLKEIEELNIQLHNFENSLDLKSKETDECKIMIEKLKKNIEDLNYLKIRNEELVHEKLIIDEKWEISQNNYQEEIKRHSDSLNLLKRLKGN